MTNNPNEKQSFRALDALGDDLGRVAEADAQAGRRPRVWRIGTAIAVGLIALPVGYAIGQDVIQDDAVPASDCADANAVYEERGLPVPDEYGPTCPDADELARALDESFVSKEEAAEDPALGGDGSQNLDQADEFDEAFRNGESIPDVEERGQGTGE